MNIKGRINRIMLNHYEIFRENGCIASIEKINDKFFGKDGNEVTESDYNLQCKTHTCEEIDNKFFDKNGNEVTEDEYNLQCKTHTCEIVGNKYFDKDVILNDIFLYCFLISKYFHSCVLIFFQNNY